MGYKQTKMFFFLII